MFNTSVDKILSSFTKTIKKLEAHISQQETNIYVAHTAITAAEEMKAGAIAERDKAAKVISKLHALIN